MSDPNHIASILREIADQVDIECKVFYRMVEVVTRLRDGAANGWEDDSQRTDAIREADRLLAIVRGEESLDDA